MEDTSNKHSSSSIVKNKTVGVGNLGWMVVKDVLAHASFARLVTDPKLFVLGPGVATLTLTANMGGRLLADHALALMTMVRIALLSSLGWCWRCHLVQGLDRDRRSPLPVVICSISSVGTGTE